MKKRILNFILTAFFALALAFGAAACGGDKEPPLEDFDVIDHEIAVTGDGDDPAYALMPLYKMGVRLNVDVKFINVEAGLYVYMKSNDTSQMYHRSSIEESDYLEITFDAPSAAPTTPNSSIFRFRIDVLGRYEYSVGTGNVGELFRTQGSRVLSADKPVAEIVSGDISDADFVASGKEVQQLVFKRSGTPTCTASTLSPDRPVLEGSESYNDTDEYFSFEAFFSWNELDSDRVREMGAAFAHNDIQDVLANVLGYHNNVSVETPNRYHRLRFVGQGKGVGRPTVASEIAVDGKMDEAQWDSAPTLSFPGQDVTNHTTPLGGPSYPIRARAFFGGQGLYLGVHVADKTLNAPAMDRKGDGGQVIYNNDHVELRLHLFKNSGGDAVRSFSVLYDVLGNSWYNSPVSTMCGFDSEFKMTAYGTVGDDSDEDEGWCFEMFIPYYELKVEAKSKAYAMILYGIKNISVSNGAVSNYGIQLNYPGADYTNDEYWHKVDKFMRIRQ
ncbi:MAG: hypothetical protein LBL66_07810 [Clostridiales bacterium]|jgi:hypothetical protein|nr:hypothetical protein [Clostridiales bacterium]